METTDGARPDDPNLRAIVSPDMFDRGLLTVAVNALSKRWKVEYESAHARILVWGRDNPHPEEQSRYKAPPLPDWVTE
jgi:hypothetical protein